MQDGDTSIQSSEELMSFLDRLEAFDCLDGVSADALPDVSNPDSIEDNLDLFSDCDNG